MSEKLTLTKHNGRSGQNGVYNPKHNDRSFNVEKSEHIDPERMKHNIYWDFSNQYSTWETRGQNEELSVRFDQIERAFYAKRYEEFCQGQHERNRKSGHSKRDRTTEDLRLNKKTCPEESLIQIGSMEVHVSPDILLDIAIEYFNEYRQRFGEHVHILDWSLHVDESTPHIHERHVFDCENAYGEIAPQQEKALERLGIPLPFPDQPNSKTNNRKVMFDSICRTMLLDIAREHGLHMQEEPQYGGRDYLKKQDYIIMKQKVKLEEQNQHLKEKEAKLETITLRIEDTEAFIDEVAEVAYIKAVEVVTDKVAEETHNMDFDMIKKFKTNVTSQQSLNTPLVKSIAEQVLDKLLEKFRGLTQHISEKLAHIFMDPDKKEEYKTPIKDSLRTRLAKAKQDSDNFSAERKQTQRQPQKSQHNMER